MSLNRDQDVWAATTSAETSLNKAIALTTRIRRLESDLPGLFHDLTELTTELVEAGIDFKIGLSPELGAAYQRWLDDCSGRGPDSVPDFLRS
jgi:hypothetical protein